ncbi:AAA family ATPase [Amycolatopsis acidicola]|uniref:AAA family ATPase n=1 Tax=Amycolatopsis acidicola TaxID=2596893 RepID=UPI001409FCD1|nr:LuxR C-terminal-related transcriptional regulator [Amycolatopsis acidicola]
MSLHGRDHELATLADLVRRAREGRGGTVEIHGSTGLGKTALLTAAEAAAEEFVVLRVRGVATEKALSLAGLNQLLRPVAHHVALLPQRHAVALAIVAGCDLGDSEPHSAPPDEFSLCSALTSLLTELARETPVLCRADDLHLIDEESRRALLFAARRLAAEPIVFLLADSFPGPAEFPRLALDPLDDDASRRVLDQQVSDGLPTDLAEELISLASGNPRALTELATSLTHGQLAGTTPPPVALPPDSPLRAEFRGRFDRLSPDARKLVRIAAADEWLDVDTVVRLATETGIALTAIEEATESGLLLDQGGLVETPNRLVRSSVYADMPLADRQQAHELLARILDTEERHLRALAHRAAISPIPNGQLADELEQSAATARRSRDYKSSARACRQAADLTSDPTVKAIRLLSAARDCWLAGRTQRSRALLHRLRPLTCDTSVRGLADLLQGEIELRDGTPAIGHRLLLDAAHGLTESHLPLAATALMYAAEASCLAGNVDGFFLTAQRASALSSPEEPPLLQLVYDHFDGLSAALSGRHDEAREPLRRVIKLAELLPGCAPKTWASVAALVVGDDVQAQELATQAVDAALGDGNSALAPWALEFLAYSALRLDQYSAAATASVEGLRLSQVAGQHNCAINHLTMLALAAALLGDREKSLARLESAAEEAAKRGLSRPTASTAWTLACLDLADDRPADALTRLRPVVSGADNSNPFVRVMAIPAFIEAAVRCDENAAATVALETFDRWACGTMNTAYLALSQRCQALVADDDEAGERFREALRLHRAGGRPFELAKTELFYGERLRRSRKPRAARTHLRHAWKTFQRYEASYWADRARAELRAAGEAVDHTAPASVDLTPQQAQISRLVAAGATNREVAAQLFLSPRTVEHHLRNIFAKLGIRSRVELTAFFRQGDEVAQGSLKRVQQPHIQ